MTSLVTPFHIAKGSKSFFTHKQLCLVTQAHNQLVAKGDALDYTIFFRPKFTSFVVLGIDDDGNQIDLRHITAKKIDNGKVVFQYSVEGYSAEQDDFKIALENFSNGLMSSPRKKPRLMIVT